MPEHRIYCPTKGETKTIDMASKPSGDICPICEREKYFCNFTIVPVGEAEMAAVMTEKAVIETVSAPPHTGHPFS